MGQLGHMVKNSLALKICLPVSVVVFFLMVLSGTALYYLHAGLSYRWHLDDHVHAELWFVLLLGGGTVCLVAVLTLVLYYYLLRRYVSIPVYAIELAMEARSRGEKDVYADVIARDEIGRLAIALNSMIERQLESSSKYAQVLNTIKDGVVAMDGEGRILVANPALESMLGYGEGALTGRKFQSLLETDTMGEVPEEAPVSNFSGEHSICHKDGARLTVEITVAEMETVDGIGYTGVVRDIRVQKAAQESLEFNNEVLRIQTALYACIQSSQHLDELVESILPVIAHMRGMGASGGACLFLVGPDNNLDALGAYGFSLQGSALKGLWDSVEAAWSQKVVYSF